ncbi:ABC transporter substrate-binding protein [Nakamurella alba]|uniref:ABC transporter substrate-binding protein n=1 Tax=Nakamurella alba TaxID=2665158 RepID=UPI0018ABA0FB|nr:ABC transporter substrate-binding protein [Nakamurella alba]
MAALIAVAALGLTACSSGSSADADDSSTLTIGASAAPRSLDPTIAANGVPGVWYIVPAYDALIERAPDGTTKPGLATDWAYSADRMSFVLNLRSGVKFSDGSDLTAEAVVKSLQRYQESGTLVSWFSRVSTVSATGPMQVTVALKTPDPMLTYAFDQGGLAGAIIGPKGLADPDSLGSSTNGAGPYMIDPAQTIANSQYTYIQNPYYYDKSRQHYKKIVIKVFTDGNSLLSAVRSGQVQVAQGVAANADAAKSAGLTVSSAPSGLLGAYIADQDGVLVPALGEVKVRQALNYAIDRASIVSSLYGEYGRPTDQFVPESIAGYVPALQDHYPYDPAKAKQLLAEAGYPDGFSFSIVEQPAVDNGDLLTQALVAAWKEIGVDVTIKTAASFPAYQDLIRSKKYPATTFTFQYSAQLTVMRQMALKPSGYNWLEFTNDEAVELATTQLKYDVESADGKKAAEASNTFMVENAFAIPVVSSDALLFSAKGVDVGTVGTYPWPDPTSWTPAT